LFGLCLVVPIPVAAQVDQALAATYFEEAAELCKREGGRLWGVSLCGPMIIADATTDTIAANQPIPHAPKPRFLGYANTAMKWGETRWSTFVWQMVPADDRDARGRMMMHELFHRIQPQLGLLITRVPGQPDHLNMLEGRFWLQLEWRALATALRTSGEERTQAIEDALSFRKARRLHYPGSEGSEQPSEINEGLAQYTGTVAAFDTREKAIADTINQLEKAEDQETFVLTFAYPSGTAYGMLLDDFMPGWTRRIKHADDLGKILMRAAKISPTKNARQASVTYGGRQLWVAEGQRERKRKLRVAELRRKFVEGPVLVMPRGRNAVFVTLGVTPIPGHGTIYPSYRVTGKWGNIEAKRILVSIDGESLTVPASIETGNATLSGDGWRINLNPGWSVRSGSRSGDYQIISEDQ
jgi:hypothetical protein